MLLELLFELSREIPERHAARRMEELAAATSGDLEDDACLGESVSGGKTALEHDGSSGAEHALRVPPAGSVHLTVTCDDKAKLEEATKVDRAACGAHR